MRCPKCRSALEKKRHEGDSLYRCRDCRSYLVPLSVLENILDGVLSASGREASHSPGEMADYLRMHGRMHKASMACPSCDGSMVRKSYPAIRHTALDFCWVCRVVWFDRGELGKVADFEPPEEAEDRPPAQKGGRRRTPGRRKSMQSLKRVSRPQMRGYMPDDVVYLGGFLSAYQAAKQRARQRRSGKKKKNS
jgi:Zn-finger nucleic acid-binding protein